jgi:hypothetical protein
MSKKIKLGVKANQVLAMLQKGGAAYYHPYMGRFNPREYWDIDGTTCTREMKKFIELGWVDVNKTSSVHGRKATINEEGMKHTPDLPEEIDMWVLQQGVFRGLELVHVKGVKITASRVRIKDQGEYSIDKQDRQIFFDREEAFTTLIQRLGGKLDMAKRQVKDAQKQLDKALNDFEAGKNATTESASIY